MIISRDAEKQSFVSINTHSCFKNHNKIKISGHFLNMTMYIHYSQKASLLPKGEKLEAFLLKSRLRQHANLSPIIFDIVWEALCNAANKGKHLEAKEEVKYQWIK